MGGPKHLACVEFSGGVPLWKRRARARMPCEDPENVSLLCKKEIEDTREEVGMYDTSSSTHTCIHTHTCVSIHVYIAQIHIK